MNTSQNDLLAQYNAFLQQLSQIGGLTDQQLAGLQGSVPGMELFNQYQQTQLAGAQNDLGFAQNDLGFAQVDYGLKKLQSDFQLSQMQVEQARKDLEFQSGPYYDYLVQKTANDTTQSNNSVITSNNQVKMSGDNLNQSRNQTLQSAYGLDNAKMQNEADKLKYYAAMGFQSPTLAPPTHATGY